MSPFLAMPEERQPPKRSSSIILTVILLAIIGYASYRVWPPLVDIWQRMHEPTQTAEPPVNAPPAIPAANSPAPEPKSADAVRPAEPEQKPASLAAEENAAPAPTPTPTSDTIASGKPPEAAPVSTAVEIPAPPRKPAAPFATPAAISLKSTLGSQLAGISLASKVKLRVTGNTLTLSGQLSSQEHTKILALLHDVPGGVRIIDDIGFADEPR
jgi:outer membrane biosynthesis protein TonB